MPSFEYRAASATGQVRQGVLDADNAAQAIALLQAQGLRPISASAVASAGQEKNKVRRARPDQMARAISELSVLVGAGLSLDRSLAIIIDNVESPALASLFDDLHRQVKEGRPLSEAISAAGTAFPAMAAPMIAAGEASGGLAPVLAKLAEALERTEKLRRDATSALIYPVMLIGIGTAVILLMLLFVVPQFEGLFGSAQDRLPTMTRLVMGASQGLRRYGLILLVLIAGMAFLSRAWLAQPGVRAALDRQWLAIPHVGELIRRIEIARFARVLGNLLAGGVPLPLAIGLGQRTIGNRTIAHAVGEIALRVREGEPFSQQATQSGMFPRMALSFIRTGEETAQLDRMLSRLADVLDEEVALRLKRLMNILTPLMTVIMGVIVATVIGSIMTAILGFNDLALE